MKSLGIRILALSAVLLLAASSVPAASNCGCEMAQPCSCCEGPTSSCSPALDVDCAADVPAHDHDLLTPTASVDVAPVQCSFPEFDSARPTDHPVVFTTESPPPAPSYLRLCTLLI